jgi:hypothetical protein
MLRKKLIFAVKAGHEATCLFQESSAKAPGRVRIGAHRFSILADTIGWTNGSGTVDALNACIVPYSEKCKTFSFNIPAANWPNS